MNMNQQNIASIVTSALENASETFLEQIAAHGIHNLTNDFHGETQDEYDAFAAEFESQAKDILSNWNH
jgi:hypothetical protein